MPKESSVSFDLLHESVKRWIYEQGWHELRSIQEYAIEPILKGERDVIITASTAGGKTEAAFFPIISKLAESPAASARALYVAPLKALINDQWGRLDDLCLHAKVPVHRWHGDVASNRKHSFLEAPEGILLITPESLESFFINHGSALRNIFGSLAYVVIDELHSFLGNERGKQLQSLLHRLELILRRRIVRIGLSATLGDMSSACHFLRRENAEEVLIISRDNGNSEIKLLIKGFVARETERGSDDDCHLDIAKHLFQTLRGSNNLVFANSRSRVELYADLLRSMSERSRLPNEFIPHHGSLSKETREFAENALREGAMPVNAICTSTLEMGIDIGSVKSIAQIGVPPSVSSIRQRLGRSGRRGEAAIMRMYIVEDPITAETTPQDALRAELIQAIATVNLLIKKWNETPDIRGLHLSTMVQQILSLAAQYGTINPLQSWEALCKSGAFFNVTEEVYVKLLRCMGEQDLLSQDAGGDLLLGQAGERMVNHYTFYAAFNTPEEYILQAEGKTLGTLPFDRPLLIGSLIIFAGKRWKVTNIDERKKIVTLIRASGGKPPRFAGNYGMVDDAMRTEMHRIYSDTSIPAFLDEQGRMLLSEARTYYAQSGLHRSRVIAWGKDCLFLPWAGDVAMDTIAVILQSMKLTADHYGISIVVTDISPGELKGILREILKKELPKPEVLARYVQNKEKEKYDPYLSEELMAMEFASRYIDIPKALESISKSLA